MSCSDKIDDNGDCIIMLGNTKILGCMEKKQYDIVNTV